MNAVLERLTGGLIVSVQAREGSALDDPRVIAAMARAAQDNGAAAVRIQGVENLRAVRAAVSVPIVGLIKRTYAGFEPYITPTTAEVDDILECGAPIVAFDATGRTRPAGATVAAIVQRIRDAGRMAMADCASLGDGTQAASLRVDIVATTLCGYTKETSGARLPALDLVRGLRTCDAFVICEGGIHTPAQAREALDSGAQAVVVGTAITNTEWLVGAFAQALR
ncbi:MAG: N-acetylmannosamine-6-phosphate 2-epimerase [Vulcanimicrobiaceae bacterium]